MANGGKNNKKEFLEENCGRGTDGGHGDDVVGSLRRRRFGEREFQHDDWNRGLSGNH